MGKASTSFYEGVIVRCTIFMVFKRERNREKNETKIIEKEQVREGRARKRHEMIRCIYDWYSPKSESSRVLTTLDEN